MLQTGCFAGHLQCRSLTSFCCSALFWPQVKEFGCSSFSLLFDDIEAEMCPADKQAFSSFAHAQVDITNTVYRHLGEPTTFLFCPTGESRPLLSLLERGPLNATFALCFSCRHRATSRLLRCVLHSHCVPVHIPAHGGREAAAWDRHSVDW